MFVHMTEHTANHLQSIEANKMDPNLVEDFFGLIARYFRYLPAIALRPDIAENQMKLALKVIGIRMENAAKALYQYFEEIFRRVIPELPNAESKDFVDLVTKGGYGAKILQRMIEYLYDRFPSWKICNFMDDVFIQILVNSRETSVQWWINALMNVPKTVLSSQEKESFIKNLKARPYLSNVEYYRDFLDKFYKRCEANSNLQL